MERLALPPGIHVTPCGELALRGKAEQVAAYGVASPQGKRGIDNAEHRIGTEDNAKNPNARREQDADASNGKSRK